MSFLKITDPKKRDLIVNDYLKTKEHIKTQQTEERTGERDLQKRPWEIIQTHNRRTKKYD